MAEARNRNRIIVTRPPPKPLLIYDGECDFCMACVRRFESRTGTRIDYAPSQQVAPQYPEISREAFNRAVLFVDTTGEVAEGAEATFRALAHAPRWAWLLWMYRHFPGFRRVSEVGYSLISRQRGRLWKYLGWLLK